MRELPVRGAGVRELALALPPGRMPAFQRGRPLKRWRYLGVYRSDLMLCVGHARVAGGPQRWWAGALPDASLFGGSRGVELDARRASVRDVAESELPGAEGVVGASAHGGAYRRTFKLATVEVRARVLAGEREFEI